MTTAYALVAPLRLGEDAKRIVRSLGIGRTDLKVGRREGVILIPLREPIEPPLAGTTIEVAEFNSTRPPRGYRDVVQIPDKYRDQLPSSFDLVGDLALIKIPDAIRVFGPAIAEAIMRVHKNVKGVFHDEGVQGAYRLRTLIPLAGVDRTRTMHTEFGTRLEVDVAKAYFSPRLANEHDRVSRAVQTGEVVVDATAGVGPFAVLIGRQRRAARVIAFDINPDAVALLRENVKIHRIEDKVEVHEEDAAKGFETTPPFDRAIINLPHGGEELVERAAARAKPGATIHYFRILSETERTDFVTDLVARIRAATGRVASVTDSRVVHAYSPQDRLYGFDLRVSG